MHKSLYDRDSFHTFVSFELNFLFKTKRRVRYCRVKKIEIIIRIASEHIVLLKSWKSDQKIG